jgi:lysyl-tRNA synthetase class 2
VTHESRAAVSSTPPTDSLEASRAEKLHRIEQLGLDPWGGRFDGHTPIADIRALPAVPFEQNPTGRVRAAGRITLRRIQGKGLHFLRLWDQTGQVQVMLNKRLLGDPDWELASNFDLGDLLGVDGVFGLTRTGEPTILADKLTYLGKSLEPHPEKWHGMHDVEFRLRHRYLDLVYTPDTLRRAKQRIQILRTIRNHLDSQGYQEVETPVLHSVAGGAAARPFQTHHNALDIDLFLRIALELPLKRLLVGGLEKVYELGRVFRNEGIDRRHNPEFTMLELYQAYGDYRSMMDLTEGLILALVDALGGGRQRPYGDQTVDFTPPWPRRLYADLFREHVGVDMTDRAGVRRRAQESHIPADLPAKDPATGAEVRTAKDHDVLVQELFEHYVEAHLAGPVFVHDYPAALCPLTKRRRDNPEVAERFELYVCGMELANAYTELNDPVMQDYTFRQQLAGLPEEESMAKLDEDFIRALRHAMPPAGGLGIGIDRLVMLLTDAPSITDVILFPLLRPEKKSE